MRPKIMLSAMIFASLFFSTAALTQPEPSPYFIQNDRYLEVNGAMIRIREEGPMTAPPIILLHGFSFSLESWDAWAAGLKSDYRVIRYDLLGHGLTGPDPKQRYAPEERAAFIGDVMDTLGLKSAIIGGNSLGGLTAWRFAAENPDRVQRLVLVAPGGFSINGVAEKPVSPPEPVKAFFRAPSRPAVAYTLSRLFVDQTLITDRRIDLMEHMMKRPGNGEALIQSIEEFTLPAPEEILQSIGVPTLILWGEKDGTIPVAQADLFQKAMPRATVIKYPKAAHVPHEDLAEKSLVDLITFLRD